MAAKSFRHKALAQIFAYLFLFLLALVGTGLRSFHNSCFTKTQKIIEVLTEIEQNLSVSGTLKKIKARFHVTDENQSKTHEPIHFNEVAEITLAYRPKIKASQRPKVTCSRQVFEVLRRFWNSDVLEYIEQFQVMLMRRANRLLGICTISTGGTAGTVVDPKVVFEAGLKANASSLILSHNHPTGNFQPSNRIED